MGGGGGEGLVVVVVSTPLFKIGLNVWQKKPACDNLHTRNEN